MRRIFFDMEFTGLRQHTTPISLGIVTEGLVRSFYWEFNDYDPAQVDEWVGDNVLPQLGKHGCGVGLAAWSAGVGSREECAVSLRLWLNEMSGPIEVWSDCLAYDWVLFCELFGRAKKLPDRVFYIPQDISTLLWAAGVDPDINREEFAGVKGDHKHFALWDAQVIFYCFRKLQTMLRMNDV